MSLHCDIFVQYVFAGRVPYSTSKSVNACACLQPGFEMWAFKTLSGAVKELLAV